MPLSPDAKERLRGELEALAARLVRDLESSAEAARPVALDQPSVGRVSRIDAIQQQKMLEANRASQRSRSSRRPCSRSTRVLSPTTLSAR